MRFALFLIAAGLAVGCSQRLDLSLLELNGAQALVFVTQRADVVEVTASPIVEGQAVYSSRNGRDEAVMVSALVYAVPLDGIFLEAGPVPTLAADDENARPLPRPDQIQLYDAQADTAAWVARDALAEAAQNVRIAAPAPIACAEAGGCYASADARDAGDCRRPCAEPTIAPPEPPSEPELPHDRPCPTGWLDAEISGALMCRPPPRLASCPDGEVQWVDSDRCVSISPPCPAGGFVAWPDDGREQLYVRAGAVGGDGSEAAPFGTLSAAMAAAHAQSVVLVAPGSYAEQVTAPFRDMTIAGACAALVRLEPAGFFVNAQSSGLTFIDLTLAVTAGAITIGPGSDASFRRVIIDQRVSNSPVGIDVQGRLNASELGILLGDRGAELSVTSGQADLRRVVIDGGLVNAVSVLNHAAMTLSDFSIVRGSRAIDVDSASLTLSNGAIQQMQKEAIVFDTSSTIAIDARLVVSEVGESPSNHPIYGVRSQIRGGPLLIENSHGTGLAMHIGGVHLHDVVVSALTRDANTLPYLGYGMHAQDGEVELDRVLISNIEGAGLGLNGRAVVRDLVIEDVPFRPGIESYFGINAGDGIAIWGEVGPGTEVTLERVRIERASVALTAHTRTSITVRDLLVRDAEGAPASQLVGIQIADGPVFDLTRARIERVQGDGVSLLGRENLRRLHDLALDASGGIVANAYPTAFDTRDQAPELARVAITNSYGSAICIGQGWEISAVDLLVEAATGRGQPCYNKVVEAVGVTVGGLSLVDLQRFRISNPEGIGLQLDGQSSASVSDGHFDHNSVAIEAGEGAPATFMERVRFSDNAKAFGR